VNENQDYGGRHECAFVQAGSYFLLMGGREFSKYVDRYEFDTDTWSNGADAPKSFNHFQAVNYQGLIWVVGAFNTNNYPNEMPEPNIHVYDPAIDKWIVGPSIPEGRRRGAAGLVLYEDQFYLVGGNTLGHSDNGSVSFMDRFDPRTGEWEVLADAPRARDHFQAVVAESKLYCIGGRAPVEIPEVDVYDLRSTSWMTLPDVSLPFPRAGAATVSLGAKSW
jgi:N-acetylneuraminic acid mutarotase